MLILIENENAHMETIMAQSMSILHIADLSEDKTLNRKAI